MVFFLPIHSGMNKHFLRKKAFFSISTVFFFLDSVFTSIDIAMTPVLEGFVVCKKNPEYDPEDMN